MFPGKIEKVVGVMAIETSSSCTAKVVVPVSPPKVAEIVVSPVPVLAARPGVVVLMVATVETDELQVALAVTVPEVPLL